MNVMNMQDSQLHTLKNSLHHMLGKKSFPRNAVDQSVKVTKANFLYLVVYWIPIHQEGNLGLWVCSYGHMGIRIWLICLKRKRNLGRVYV